MLSLALVAMGAHGRVGTCWNADSAESANQQVPTRPCARRGTRCHKTAGQSRTTMGQHVGQKTSNKTWKINIRHGCRFVLPFVVLLVSDYQRVGCSSDCPSIWQIKISCSHAQPPNVNRVLVAIASRWVFKQSISFLRNVWKSTLLSLWFIEMLHVVYCISTCVPQQFWITVHIGLAYDSCNIKRKRTLLAWSFNTVPHLIWHQRIANHRFDSTLICERTTMVNCISCDLRPLRRSSWPPSLPTLSELPQTHVMFIHHLGSQYELWWTMYIH